MNMSLGDIARIVGGELRGDAATPVTGAAIIRDAQAGDITLADNSQRQAELAGCRAAAVVVPAGFEPEGIPFLTVKEVHAAFAQIVAHFRPPVDRRHTGVSSMAHVAASARLGRDSVILPGAFLGENVQLGDRCTIHSGARILENVRLGDDVTIFPNAVLYEHTVVGDRVIVHAGAVLGAYGFGYKTEGGQHQLSPQLGFVLIEDDVEIGACSTIDRGTYGPTTIGQGTKIDNQVMVAHNCRIGKYNMLCSQVGIAGSCTTGDYVVMAGQVGLRDHVNVGDRAVVAAQAGIMNDVPADSVYLGSPGAPERETLTQWAATARLPAMRKEFRALQRQVDQLERFLRRDAA